MQEHAPFALPYPLPGGRYRISTEENARVCRAVGAEPRKDRRAHPVFFYIATQSGMGASVQDLFDLCRFDPSDGPLMVKTRADFARPLFVERDYAVSGEIIGLTRKPSRTFGAADLFEFVLRLDDSDGARAVECTNTWLLPRRNAL